MDTFELIEYVDEVRGLVYNNKRAHSLGMISDEQYEENKKNNSIVPAVKIHSAIEDGDFSKSEITTIILKMMNRIRFLEEEKADADNIIAYTKGQNKKLKELLHMED